MRECLRGNERKIERDRPDTIVESWRGRTHKEARGCIKVGEEKKKTATTTEQHQPITIAATTKKTSEVNCG